MSYQGTLYIIAAPSGAGKTSLVNSLVKTLPHLSISISHTTRAMRPQEQDGVNYYFVNDEQFKKMTEENVFLEYAQVFGHQYGSAKDPIISQLNKGIDVILEIDWQGARLAREQIKNSVSIFILPPSQDSLKKRLTLRAQDNEATIGARMQAATQEMSHYNEFDYLIINDDFEHAKSELATIIHAQRLKRDNHFAIKDHWVESLLKP